MPITGELTIDKGKAKDVPSTDHASLDNSIIGDVVGTERASANDATATNVTSGNIESNPTTSGGLGEVIGDSGNTSGPSGGDRESGTKDTTKPAEIVSKDTSDFRITSSGINMSVSRHVVEEAVFLGMRLEVGLRIRVSFLPNTNIVDKIMPDKSNEDIVITTSRALV